MNFLRNHICYIYLALWVTYYLQDMLTIHGLIAQVIFVALMVMSFYAFFQVNMNYRMSSYLKWLNLMVVVLTIYGLVPVIGGWTLTGSGKVGTSWMTYLYIQEIYISVMPIYAFYYFALTKKITSEKMIYAFLLLFFFSILMYYQSHFEETAKLHKEEITNNAGYFFVPLIPLLYLLKIRDVWKYIFLFIMIAYLIMSMKRGAILTGSVVTFLFLVHNLKSSSWEKGVYVMGLSVLVLSVIYIYTLDFYEDSAYFQKRVDETLSGNSSYRDEIYTSYLTYFFERTSSIEFLIGNGANATIVLLGEYAHNDWLEFAIDLGMLGVLMYLVYWILFIREWKNYNGSEDCKFALRDIIIAYFLIALFSMSFNHMPFAATFCIGYCLANKTLNDRSLRLIYRK